jgi:hypothetical protein
MTLSDHFEVMEAVKVSIASQYDGELEVTEDWEGSLHYTPLDDDRIRQLLIQEFGDVLSGAAIEEAFTELVNEGAEEWPKAWCQAWEEEQRDSLGIELDIATDNLDEMRKRRGASDRGLLRLEAEVWRLRQAYAYYGAT